MPMQSIKGTALHYAEKGTGPVLLLLHAFPVDSRMWQAQISALSDQYRIIAPDYRGFGQSKSTDSISIDSLADDANALLDVLHARPAVVAGISMGGYVALAMARKYPQALRGLVLIDTRADADTPQVKEARRVMIDLVRAKGSASVGETMQPRLLSPDTIKSKPVIVKRFREMTDSQAPLTIENTIIALRDRPDQTGVLGTVSVPTLVIVGDADSVTPPTVAEKMQQSIKGATLALIRGAGHMTPMEQPEQVNAAMHRFLAD